ncbi:Ail/Lom family outer membrane beta-barrel protein [Enterobacteriaceae bacterium H11S18]|uniref:Ail/Lom family outer membrane beta-barrel protein n=1 Tax=Dryocola clanedunensis TaxID=2925396 RepID=UPI0022F04DB1|nr:Ail/Lom family outer membrane beta-barrel protein [Dryocola clanedunensis]MCT4713111.1 Ail/Lom family outer membrane beta-barrel protein [Dryocola clanedunensis]
MNKNLLAIAVFSALAVSSLAQAQSNTVSIGYAQANVENFDNLKGVNVKYRYEWDSPLSVITSFTYMGATVDDAYSDEVNDFQDHDDFKYYSLSVGPAYRFNEYVSVYGLLGAAYGKVNYDYHWESHDGEDKVSMSGNQDSTRLMYGADVQINPMDNLVIDVGYEGSDYKNGDGDTFAINGFNLGIGYRF